MMKAWLMRFSAAGFLSFCVGALPAAAQDMPEMTTQDLGHGLYVLYGQGGNVGVSTGVDGTIIIDDQFEHMATALLGEVETLSDEPVRFVLNTHYHGDHVGGNEQVGEATGAVIVAHENVRVRMSTEQVSELMERTTPAYPDSALPVLTFDSGVTFHWNDLSIQVMHMPHAHTDGDAVVVFPEANVIHMGDIFFNGFYPFIDVEAGGSIDGMIAAVDRALEIADDETVIIAGHGPVGGREDLSAYRDMLVGTRDAIAGMIAADATIAEVRASDVLDPWDAVWADGFMTPENYASLVYLSMTGN